MYCINLLKRSRQKKIVFYCKEYKRYIDYQLDCKNCLKRNLVRNKGIKKKSNKLIKLERQRDNKIIKKGKCEYCNRYFNNLDAHEVYGGSNRKRSILYGFVKKLCRECHSNEDILNKIKINTQIEYEKTHTREEFIQIIGKSYLKEEK